MAADPDSCSTFLVKEMTGLAQQRSPQQRIVIGICTRQRNALLCRLINSIMAQAVPKAYSVELLVVDNNDSPMAADALSGLSGPFPITVVHEPRAGLVFARNRSLDEAVALQADWFLGLDDDMWVAGDWLSCFVAGLETIGRPVLMGPCERIYDNTRSPFLRAFQFPVRPLGDFPSVIATGNCAIHRCVFDPENGAGLRFDIAFNESGGEDFEFFMRAKRTFGWDAASYPLARTYEDWDGVRGTLGYWLSRAMRGQLNVYRANRTHRQAGIFGSRKRNTTRILTRVNRQVFHGVGSLMIGLAHLAFDRAKGRHLIGDAMIKGARISAILPFIFGLIPAAYGQRAKTITSHACSTQTNITPATPEGN